MQLQIPDNGVPGSGVILQPDRVLELLNQAGIELDVLPAINYVRYKPSTSCLVGYSVCKAGKRMLFHAKAMQRKHWGAHSKKLERLCKTAGGQNILRFERLGLSVLGFPADLGMRSLARFLATRSVDQTFGSETAISTRVRAADVMSYKPARRCALRVETDDAPHFVKLYHASRFAGAVERARNLQRTQAAVPAFLGKSRRHRAIAWRWIDGRSLAELIRRDAVEDAHLCSLVEELGRLHSAAIPKSKFLLRRPTTAMRVGANYLAAILPAAGPLAHRLAIALDEELNGRLRARPSLVHGDLHPQQILVAKDRLHLCDFDNVGLDDAVTDIGRLVGHLKYQAIIDPQRQDRIQSIVQRITELYLRLNQRPDLRRRLQAAELMAMFQLSVTPFRTGNPNWAKDVIRVLQAVQEGREMLAKHVVGGFKPCGAVASIDHA